MQDVLQSLNTIPGIVGSMVIGEDGTVLSSVFPPLYDAQTLDQIAMLLSDETTANKGLKTEGVLIEFRYQQGRVFARPIRQGLLAVLGTTAVNAQLLGMTFNLAAKKLERDSGNTDTRALTPPPAPATISAIAVAIPGLPKLRERLKEALIRQIGPIGGVVFERRFARWAATGPSSRESLKALVKSLCEEIDEPSACEEFKKDASIILV